VHVICKQEIKTVKEYKSNESKPPPDIPPPPLPAMNDPWEIDDGQNDYYVQVSNSQYQQQNKYSHQQASLFIYSIIY